IISHDLEIVDYCDRIMILEEGVVSKLVTPEDLVNDLPGRGKGIEISFNAVTWQLMRDLERLPDVEYIIRSGRNKVKIFAPDIENKLISYLKFFNNEGIEARDISVQRTGFVDFFKAKPWREVHELIR
ncbi:MAG: hypothetical protein ACW976_04040, partial [Candidatus Ranarchaeia archaeon]